MLASDDSIDACKHAPYRGLLGRGFASLAESFTRHSGHRGFAASIDAATTPFRGAGPSWVRGVGMLSFSAFGPAASVNSLRSKRSCRAGFNQIANRPYVIRERVARMPIVNFVNEKKQVQVPEGSNLRNVARDAGVQLYPGVHKFLNCRGLAQCGSCRVRIVKGTDHAAPKTTLEKLRLGVSLAYIGNEDTMRLACQTKVEGDMDVETQPPMNLYGENFFS